MKINVTAEIQIPRLPNYLKYGDEDGQSMDVADLSVEDLKALGAAWTEALVEHALKRRNNRETTK